MGLRSHNRDTENEDKTDAAIRGLLGKIENETDFEIVSSCAGRIVLAVGKRNFREWHKADREEIELAISSYGGKGLLWFKLEPFSLELATREIDSAITLIGSISRNGAVSGMSKKENVYNVWIRGTANICFPVNPIEGSWDEIVNIANSLMRENLKQIKKLEMRL